MKPSSLGSSDAPLLELFAKRPHGIKPGLSRVKAALELLPWRHKLPPAVLVGGTNGKGSTSGMLWHLLAACQLRVGLFSSPHLVQFAERIQCSHVTITNTVLIDELHKLQQALPVAVYESLSFFEVNTLLALQTFINHDCQLLVLEVGLGGRWDATNIVEPIAAAITSIDLDHEQWLGNSLAAIGSEKLGIARPGKPLFWGERFTEQKAGLKHCLARAQQSTAFILYQRHHHFALTYDDGHPVVTISLPDLPHQRVTLPPFFAPWLALLLENFAVSLSLFYWLTDTLGLGSFAQGLRSFGSPAVPWPPTLVGRMQRLIFPASKGAPELIGDVSHNPAGITEFINYLRSLNLPEGREHNIPLFFSCLEDKDCTSMLDLVLEYANPVILFRISSERSFTHEQLAARHGDLPMFADFAKAWHYATNHWQAFGRTWALCGSVAALGEVLSYFNAFPTQQSYQKTLVGTVPSQHLP